MFRFRRKKKTRIIDEKHLSEIIQAELNGYIKREDLQEYLDDIEKDKGKKKLWDSLSAHKKIKLLRYAMGRKGEQHVKK